MLSVGGKILMEWNGHTWASSYADLALTLVFAVIDRLLSVDDINYR